MATLLRVTLSVLRDRSPLDPLSRLLRGCLGDDGRDGADVPPRPGLRHVPAISASAEWGRNASGGCRCFRRVVPCRIVRRERPERFDRRTPATGHGQASVFDAGRASCLWRGAIGQRNAAAVSWRWRGLPVCWRSQAGSSLVTSASANSALTAPRRWSRAGNRGSSPSRAGCASTQPVSLRQSVGVTTPAVVGWLRPVILLPVGMCAGLSTAQVEMILAHELAHVGRQDYLVNLLLNVVETILFYHPAVWWIAARVREERENACDDLALAACNDDRLGYVRALASLEEMRLPVPSLALAARMVTTGRCCCECAGCWALPSARERTLFLRGRRRAALRAR